VFLFFYQSFFPKMAIRTFAFLAIIACTSVSTLFAQDWNEVQKKETFQRYDSLEVEMLLARKPLLAFAYNNLKVFGGSRASIAGIVSAKYLPGGLPQIADNTTPLVGIGTGWGLKMFLGSILYNWFFDYGGATWQIPPQTRPKTVQLTSFNTNADLGYAVWKNEFFLLTPCASIGFSRYTFDTNANGSLRNAPFRFHLGGAVDMSYFVPLLTSPFHSLEQRKLGIQEIIEAMISLRIGYSQSFEGGTSFFATPTHQELSVRLMVGIGTRKFVEDF
jgi:hypothetical protein